LREQLAELRLGVQPGADRGAALRQRIELLERDPHAEQPQLHLLRIAGKFLAERQRRRVLRVRAADLDDLGEFLGLRLQGLVQVRERGAQELRDLLGGRNVHRGRKCVVRRLAHIHVIVRMHERLLAALAAEQFGRAVGDHLVQIHVGLRAGAGLPHHQREVIVQLAVDHLLGRLHDGAGALAIEEPERLIDLGGRAV